MNSNRKHEIKRRMRNLIESIRKNFHIEMTKLLS